MVASRKDLADAIQSYSDNDNHPEKMVAPMNRSGKTDAVQIGGNDNHPEKMGNRQQRTRSNYVRLLLQGRKNLADVAAFPRCSGCKDTIKT